MRRLLPLPLALALLGTIACDGGGTPPPDAEQAKTEDKAATDELLDEQADKDEEKVPEPEPEPEPEPVDTTPPGEEGPGETGEEPEPEPEPEPESAEGGDKDGGKKEPKNGGKKPEPEPESKIDAKALFLAKCKSCHGPDGKGDTKIGKKVDIPSLVGTKLGKGKIVNVIKNGVPDTKMKAYKSKLSGEEIDALAGFIKKL